MFVTLSGGDALAGVERLHGSRTLCTQLQLECQNLRIQLYPDDLKRTPLLVDPPDDVDALFACYDRTLESLLDIHAPLVKVAIRSRPTAPWYDAGCANVKSNTRRLERYYRAHNTPPHVSRGGTNPNTCGTTCKKDTANSGPVQ